MIKRIANRISALFSRGSIRYMIFASFTITAFVAVAVTGGSFFLRFSNQLEQTIHEENRMLVSQVNRSLNNYLSNMRSLSDTIIFRVVKNADMDDSATLAQLGGHLEMLREANKDNVKHMAVFSQDGQPLLNVPQAMLVEGVDVAEQEWFQKALAQTENLHYAKPAVQNMFVEEENQYSWTVILSAYTEITRGKAVEQGVMMMNLRYAAIADMFRNITLSNEGYIYLIDGDGTIIYHPQHQLIATGLFQEDNMALAGSGEGDYTRTVRGQKCTVLVRSVGYTGWSVVGVIPQTGLAMFSVQNVLFVAIMLLMYFAIIVVVNAFISHTLTNPIRKLELSLQQVEMNADSAADIFIGGSQEVQHLGQSIQRMVEQLRKLTDDIVFEQTQKQKSELNALQAQINPHFLYNTLDIIVWMIEKEQPEEALKVVSALARFFRLSLSKGRNIITVGDELEHVNNYLMIQQMRYQNKFKYTIEAEPETLQLSTIKLVLQPIAENAIYHSMGITMDGDEEIIIRARMQGGDLYLSVEDNGLGMPPEMVEKLLTEQAATSMGGSGVGLKNVHERIMLYYGREYGVTIESELDEGTCVTLHMPALPYEDTEDNL